MRPREDIIPPLVLFLLWPFGAFVAAVRNYRSSWAVNVVWLFIAYFGFTFISPDEYDSSRYIVLFQEMGRHQWDYDGFVSLMYKEGTRYVDIVQPLLSYLLSIFTEDGRLLLLAFGTVFGYFYSRNMWRLLEYAGPDIRPLGIVFIAACAVVVGFWQINGFRFWTAAHVFMFGVVPFLVEGRKSYLLLAALSVFFHFSFVFPVAVVLLYLLAGNRTHLYFVFFIVSFVISGLEITIVERYFTFLPGVFQEHGNIYANYDLAEAERKVETLAWHARHYQTALKYVVLACLTAIYVSGFKGEKIPDRLEPLFSFTLLLYAAANIFSSMPSGGRFLTLGNLLATAFLFLYFQLGPSARWKSGLICASAPAIVFFFVVSIRTGLDYTGFYTFFGNPLTALWGPGEMSVMSLIKGR